MSHERKYFELKSVCVKSSPLLGRGKGWFSRTPKPEQQHQDLRNKPCGVGQTKERDGCIPAGGEQQQPKQQQAQQPQQPQQPQQTKPFISGSNVSNSPDGRLQFDPSKVKEQNKPSEEQVLKGNKQTTNKWKPAAAKFNDRISTIDQKAWDEIMPEGMTKESCVVLTGIDSENPNAVVTARVGYWGKVPKATISVSDPTIRLKITRKIKPGGVVENESFYLHKDYQGQGIGTEIFSRQVEVLAKAGMKKIQCTAQRDEDSNGYYTWPRLGYDADIEERITDHELKDKIKTAFPEAKTIQDLYKTKEGREWWKENGDTVGMDFDLKEGSQSRKILSTYLEERENRSRQKRLTLMRMKKLHWKRYGINVTR